MHMAARRLYLWIAACIFSMSGADGKVRRCHIQFILDAASMHADGFFFGAVGACRNLGGLETVSIGDDGFRWMHSAARM